MNLIQEENCSGYSVCHLERDSPQSSLNASAKETLKMVGAVEFMVLTARALSTVLAPQQGLIVHRQNCSVSHI